MRLYQPDNQRDNDSKYRVKNSIAHTDKQPGKDGPHGTCVARSEEMGDRTQINLKMAESFANDKAAGHA